jgi:uncharacterized lipoprotein YmbA
MKPFATGSRGLVAGVTTVLLTGCLNTKPVSDPTRYYVPSVPASPTANRGAPAAGIVVGLNPVTVPSYLLDRRLAVRKGTSEIVYLEFDRWAERLDSAMARVLTQNLESDARIGRVFPAPWRRDLIQRELSISFTRCDLMENGQVIVEARWHSGAPGGAEGHRSGLTRVERDGPSPASDPQGAVAALSAALAELSARIAADLAMPR